MIKLTNRKVSNLVLTFVALTALTHASKAGTSPFPTTASNSKTFDISAISAVPPKLKSKKARFGRNPASSATIAGDFTTNNASASSSLPGYPVTNVYDSSSSSVWSSNGFASAGNSQYLAFWWSQGMQSTNYVKLVPRYNGGGTVPYGFPVDFTIYYSNGSSWVADTTYTSYLPPGGGSAFLPLKNTVSANGILIVASTLGNDTLGNYLFQLGDAKAGYDPLLAPDPVVDYTTNSATASTTLSSAWAASNVYDGLSYTQWSSISHGNANATETLAYTWAEGQQNVNYIKVLPRYNGNNALCFPTNFKVNYKNGSQWTTAATFTAYRNPSNGGWVTIPLNGTYLTSGVQIVASSLGNDGVGNYAFQLSEAKAGFDGTSKVMAGFDIYSPSMVEQAGSLKMYFGGFLNSGVNDKDTIYRADCPEPVLLGSSYVSGSCTNVKTVIDPIALGIGPVNDPSVVTMPGGYYIMYTTCVDAASGSNNICESTSWTNDGLNWSKPNTILTARWLPSGVVAPSGHVYLYGSDWGNGVYPTLRLYDTGTGGVAPSAPISLNFDSTYTYINVNVSYDSTQKLFLMFGQNFNQNRIDYLTSSDGITWKTVKTGIVMFNSNYVAVNTPSPHPTNSAILYYGQTPFVSSVGFNIFEKSWK